MESEIWWQNMGNNVQTFYPYGLGDTEGHDKLCGRYLNRSANVAMHCRYCKCPSKKTGERGGPYPLILESEITNLVNKGPYGDRGLKQLSHRRITNAFRGLFGGCPQGINGNTPAELLHLIQLGLHVYSIQQFFSMKKLTLDAIKKEHADIQKQSIVINYSESSFDQKDIKVIPEEGNVPDLIDFVSKQIGEVLKRQSDKDLPEYTLVKELPA